ncbi:unnamed protein product [Ceutorhynchus assimilis]|uniref:Uncharacterized protein n=1 Tax=Ceutorhynchus assimilis TaxID=467358 RepID=A0A9N9QG08_9CUCU|nr:unnamed protein product [Ceutorhynchus assimilis]
MSTPSTEKDAGVKAVGETETEENESLLEKCWVEEYKGDSRKWLIRDASSKLPHGLLCSTMKESYPCPVQEKSNENDMGIKKRLLLKKFFEEAAEEVIKEREDIHKKRDWCTEYHTNFKADGFKVEDKLSRNTENIQKYPLYSSAPVSYYSFNQKKNPKEVLHGLTRITDQQKIFKRNGQFTKPITESLDFIEL